MLRVALFPGMVFSSQDFTFPGIRNLCYLVCFSLFSSSYFLISHCFGWYWFHFMVVLMISKGCIYSHIWSHFDFNSPLNSFWLLIFFVSLQIDLMMSDKQPVTAITNIVDLQLFCVVFTLPANVNPAVNEESDRSLLKDALHYSWIHLSLQRNHL